MAPTTFDPQALWRQLLPLIETFQNQTPAKLTVGFSGGLDSTVLLHALNQLQFEGKDFQLSAFHINHQLQSEANAWESSCKQFCEKHQINFCSKRVTLQKNSGLEADARDVRYQTFKDSLTEHELLLTAHHLNDHIETLFLKLLRGTGIDGVKGILPLSNFKQLNIVRPLLTFERDCLLAYATQQQLTWIDDPSNESDQFDRNYLRRQVLPNIAQRWPAYKQTINRFTQHAAAVAQIVDESIHDNYLQAFNRTDNSLALLELEKLSYERQALLLRYWIKAQGYQVPTQKQIQQVLKLISAREDATPLVSWGDVQLRRYRKHLFLQTTNNDFIAREYEWDLKKPLPIPGVGILEIKPVIGSGIKCDYLQQGVNVKFRVGGEVCKPHKRTHRHTLKKLLQEKAVPPWQRNTIPLIYLQHEIAAVVGWLYCDPFAASETEEGFEIILKPLGGRLTEMRTPLI